MLYTVVYLCCILLYIMLYTVVYIHGMLCGRLQRKSSAHIRDVCTLGIVDNWLFPIHLSTNHCSTKGALSKLITTYGLITKQHSTAQPTQHNT